MLRCIRRRVLWLSSSIISPLHRCSHLRRSWRWRGNYISIIGRVTIRFAVFLRLISILSTPCSPRPDNLWLPSRVQNGPPCPRDRVTDVLPADCQQRAGLHSLRSLRPLPTSTASALRANLYPSGPSPCPCPGVDTPARCRIPPAPAPPVCKTAPSAPGTYSPRPLVCKSALPAPGTSSPRPPVCKKPLPAPGTSLPQPQTRLPPTLFW